MIVAPLRGDRGLALSCLFPGHFLSAYEQNTQQSPGWFQNHPARRAGMQNDSVVRGHHHSFRMPAGRTGEKGVQINGILLFPLVNE